MERRFDLSHEELRVRGAGERVAVENEMEEEEEEDMKESQ